MSVKVGKLRFGQQRVAVAILAGVFGWMNVAAQAQAPAAPKYQTSLGQSPAAPTLPPLPTPAPISTNGAVVEDVIVRVNDQIISRSDVERARQQLLQDVQQHNIDLADGEKNLLRDMIDQQLLLSKGKELGINPDAEVVKRLDDIRRSNNLPDMDALEKAARSQGVSFEDFKAQIRNQIITQQVVREEVGRRLQLTQAQEQAFYDAHKQEMMQPEQVRLSEILVPVAADADDATVAKAQAKADGLTAKLKAGTEFAALAKSDSGGPTASQGGDLGLFKRGALAKVLEDQTFPLAAGGYTAPIRTRQGFVILKVTEHQAAGVPPMKDVEPQIQEAIYSEQMQPALRAYLTKLREQAYIDIKPGFVDSGASSKETKPVFTAYVPPAVKAKKQVDKQRFDRSGRYATASLAPGSGPAVTPPASAGSPASAGTAAGTTAPAAANASTSAATPEPLTLSNVRGPKLDKSGKPKKIHREKVRFGQAPRNSLPPSQQIAVVTTTADQPGTQASLGSAAGQGSVAAGLGLPANATNLESSNGDVDPLAPKVVKPTSKTRFSAREPEVKAKKVAAVKDKAIEKAAAIPVGPTTDETATRKAQSAPLGLNGDTGAKKKTKVKHVKGQPKPAKERLQDQAPAAPKTLPDAVPLKTDNPNLGTDKPAPSPKPSSDSTTLPPANAPAPGAGPQGNVAPAPAQPTLPPPNR